MSLLNKRYARKNLIGAVLASTMLITACSDSNDASSSAQEMHTFSVTVTNLTAGQPMSPLAVVLHHEWSAFETGSSASVSLEYLAEAGDNSHLLNDAQADDEVVDSASGAGIIAPGQSETVTVQTSENNLGTLSLSVLSMLVNTNDAIAAINGAKLGSLAVNESMSFEAYTYDAGTEANTESDDSIPGPAASGLREGFNAQRDDVVDKVLLHAGVLTQDDGLDGSVLTEAHRWDNPSILVEVERLN